MTTSNGQEIETTMFHPFYVQDEEEPDFGIWTAASNLVIGDKLLMEAGQSVYVEEVRIEKLTNPIKVYNLEIDELHTYFVASGVLGHNICENGKYEKADYHNEKDTPKKTKHLRVAFHREVRFQKLCNQPE